MDAPTPVVTIFGANDPQPGEPAYETARQVGRALAGLGLGVANGGYGGTMEASARGAKDAGGWTIGVTCRRWPTPANEFIDREEPTDDLFARLRRLIELGSAGYVVLPGATGTLAELAAVWELVNKRFLPPVPIVCVGEFWQPLIELMASQRPGCERTVTVAASADEVAEEFRRVRR